MIHLSMSLYNVSFQILKGTQTLIAGGYVNHRLVSTAYILEVHFQRDTDLVIEICYLGISNMPSRDEGLFGCICDGRAIIGVGKEDSTDVFELVRGNNWKMLPSRNLSRAHTASCYIDNHLIVTGGYIAGQGNLNAIEMLEISAHHTGDKWIISSSVMPFRVSDHSLVPFNDQLLLIGGSRGNQRMSDQYSNEIWIGKFENKIIKCAIKVENKIKWTKLKPMNNLRAGHFSFVIDNKVYVFGGEWDGNEKQTVEIFDGENWEIGPEYSFFLNKSNAQAGLDDKKRIIIVSKNHGIIVYNTRTAKISENENFRMKDNRQFYASLFL